MDNPNNLQLVTKDKKLNDTGLNNTGFKDGFGGFEEGFDVWIPCADQLLIYENVSELD